MTPLVRRVSFLLWFLAPALAAQEPLPGLFVEAEAPAAREPAEGSYGIPAFERYASGGTVIRDLREGRMHYRFELAAAGPRTLWMRYANPAAAAMDFVLETGGKKSTHRAELPATPALNLTSCYRWAKLARLDLPAGETKFEIAGVPGRLDAFYLTPEEAEPGWDFWLRLWRGKVDAATWEKLRRPLEPVRPRWLDGAGDYRLPAWFEGARVQLHTRLGLTWFRRPNPEIFLDAAKFFKELGVEVFTRHIKSGKEGAWWPTELGDVVPEARERNLAKEILDSAHALGQRVLVYHRHMEDEAMLNAHPEWACLTSKGEQVDAGRGIHMCLNTPYADYFLKRMLELVDFGADGFYFDEEHMPPAGCWCPACKDGFAKLTGLEPPPNEDHTSPLWHKFVDYNNRVVEQAFLKWRAGLHAKRPDVVMLISSNSYPAMIERHLTQRLWRATDSVKTEFHVAARKGKYQFLDRNPQLFRPEPDVRIGFAFDLSRDAADGRPPHIWTHGVPDEKSLLFATGGLLTHGAIANLDMNEKTIPNPSFKSSFDLGRKVSPFLAGTRPASWALIHYSELARDVYATDEAAWWAREMLPVLGAYEALLHARRPAGVLTDSQFEEGRFGGAKVLFLPAPEHLTEPMRKQADAFRARGGLVVENRPEWRWAEPQGAAPAREAFLKFLDAAPPCPVHATGGHPRLHLGAFENPERTRMSVLLANPFTWIFTGAAEKGEEETKARLDQAPAPGKGVIVTLAGRRPLKVTEILSGNELEIQSAAGGAWKVEAPEFEFLSFLSVEFEAAKP